MRCSIVRAARLRVTELMKVRHRGQEKLRSAKIFVVVHKELALLRMQVLEQRQHLFPLRK
jgi:hypothetical protein